MEERIGGERMVGGVCLNCLNKERRGSKVTVKMKIYDKNAETQTF